MSWFSDSTSWLGRSLLGAVAGAIFGRWIDVAN